MCVRILQFTVGEVEVLSCVVISDIRRFRKGIFHAEARLLGRRVLSRHTFGVVLFEMLFQ